MYNQIKIGYAEEVELQIESGEYDELIYGIEESFLNIIEDTLAGKLSVEGNSEEGYNVELSLDPPYEEHTKDILKLIEETLGIKIVPISRVLKDKWDKDTKTYYKKVEYI
jgi:hypothetical protein